MQKLVLMLDLGGVLENHKLFDLAKFISKKYDLNLSQFHDFMIDNLRLNDKCTITDQEFIERVNKKFNLNLNLKQFYIYYFRFISSNRNVLNLAKKLKNKCILAIFSNTRKIHLQDSLRKYQYQNLFDYIFISQNHYTRKPEIKFYKIALKTMKVKPEQVIFVDDKERNFPPARKLGINCIQFSGDIGNLKNQLKKFNLE